MWNRPATLRAIADALLVTALLAAFYAGVSCIVQLPQFPVTEVRVMSPMSHVTRQQVEAVARRELHGTFFSLQLRPTRLAFESLPWVRQAEVRKRWPGRVEVTLTEHVPLARWGETALVNTHGEVFEAAYEGDLPQFNGPAGAAKEMTIQYDHFRRGLAEINKVPREIQVSPRRAWKVRLTDGMTLDLGREHIEERLRRFVTNYARTIVRLGPTVDRVDLRYANGFAARVHDESPAASAGRQKRGTQDI